MEKYPLKCSRKPVQRDYGIAPMEGSLFIVGPLRDLLRGFFISTNVIFYIFREVDLIT